MRRELNTIIIKDKNGILRRKCYFCTKPIIQVWGYRSKGFCSKECRALALSTFEAVSPIKKLPPLHNNKISTGKSLKAERKRRRKERKLAKEKLKQSGMTNSAKRWVEDKRVNAWNTPRSRDHDWIRSAEFYDSQEWKSLRFSHLSKNPPICVTCGAKRSDGYQIHVDHIKPRWWFPHLALDPKNLQCLCRECNQGKSNIFF